MTIYNKSKFCNIDYDQIIDTKWNDNQILKITVLNQKNDLTFCLIPSSSWTNNLFIVNEFETRRSLFKLSGL